MIFPASGGLSLLTTGGTCGLLMPQWINHKLPFNKGEWHKPFCGLIVFCNLECKGPMWRLMYHLLQYISATTTMDLLV